MDSCEALYGTEPLADGTDGLNAFGEMAIDATL